MEVINDVLGYNNRKIFQNSDFFSFSLDSVMLANFVTVRLRDKELLDLGTGNAIIPLILSLRTDKKITGVEIQKKVFDLAKKSVNYNHLENQISLFCIDMKDFITNDRIEKYDIITCNPPYFKVNKKNYFNSSTEKMIARHEIKISLEEVIKVASKLLKNNGNFALVHRTDRLLEIFDLFRKYRIEPKRIQYVHENIYKESTLVLIEGTKMGKPGLKVEKPFIINTLNKVPTEEYAKILKGVNINETK